MKKLIALILVCLVCLTTAYAAEWSDGLSPEQPMHNFEKVNFKNTLGYFMMWPTQKFPALRFCDVLEMYLPRNDLELGEGKITLCDANGEIAVMDCADPAQVELRPMEESELQFPWGSWGWGSCLEVHLPVSLEFDKDDYYVLMDEGCIVDPANNTKSLSLTAPNQWNPLLQDEFGIGDLRYTKPAEEDEEPEITAAPAVGDNVRFELKLGGNAKEAVVFSENDSVYFEPFQFTESGTVTGTVTGEDVGWGIIFLDEEGKQLDMLTLKQSRFVEQAEAELAAATEG